MIAPIFIVAFAGFASLTVAQAPLGNQTVVPNSVDLNTRNGWCQAEMNTCTTLCSKDWSTNNCSTSTLEATCECADGSMPNLVNYRDTLPYFVCQEYIAQCVAGNATEPNLQNICRSTNICGNMDPADFVPATTIITSAAPSTTSSRNATGTNNPATTTTGGQTGSPSTNAGMILEPSSAGLLRLAALVAAMGLTGVGLVL